MAYDLIPNCIHFKRERCAALPSLPFFGMAKCVYRLDDRVSACSIQTKHPNPVPPPRQP